MQPWAACGVEATMLQRCEPWEVAGGCSLGQEETLRVAMVVMPAQEHE